MLAWLYTRPSPPQVDPTTLPTTVVERNRPQTPDHDPWIILPTEEEEEQPSKSTATTPPQPVTKKPAWKPLPKPSLTSIPSSLGSFPPITVAAVPQKKPVKEEMAEEEDQTTPNWPPSPPRSDSPPFASTTSMSAPTQPAKPRKKKQPSSASKKHRGTRSKHQEDMESYLVDLEEDDEEDDDNETGTYPAPFAVATTTIGNREIPTMMLIRAAQARNKGIGGVGLGAGHGKVGKRGW
ncbi:hypothetical protein HDU97_003002 [Phlyctochytrium planicorne]|nr:hypothetical protein HDU97_003002 [Phlyctochytrium planicorne]